MPALQTTVGQLMVRGALPEDLRDSIGILDGQGLKKLLAEVARKHPDKYRQVSHDLADIGRHAAYTTGGFSFSLRHMRQSRSARRARVKLRARLQQLAEDDSLSDDARAKKIVMILGRYGERQADEIYEESLAEGNPLAFQVLSGSRGSPTNLASIRGSDLLYTDHHDRVIPMPVLRSYAQGLSPAEYWAGAYGARKGLMDLKLSTSDAGFLSKQLGQISHRGVVVGLDDDKEPETLRGMPVDVADEDNEGALLAAPAGGYPRNTLLTPKVLARLRGKRIKKILVRSPIVSGAPDGGLYARDVGVREFGRLPRSGENPAMTAAQALSEPLTQAQISSKHGGGVVGAREAKAITGFDYINQLVQVPRHFKGGAAHAEIDGLVQAVEEAPAGGSYVTIAGQKHYVGSGFDLRVKKGDKVEAGDVISEGTPNPAVIVRHKGVGEGRRYFVQTFRQAFRDANLKGHRRNIELLARGLINHVRLTEEMGDFAPDDVVTYSALEQQYKPRVGFRTVDPRRAKGAFLERPYLHYSVGTRVQPSVIKNLRGYGIETVDVHDEPPPFQPEMVRGMANLQHDPDWVTRMFGSGQRSSIIKAVHRGATSDVAGTSFVPGLARASQFGHVGKVVTPQRKDDESDALTELKTAAPRLSEQAVSLRTKLIKESADRDRASRVAALQHVVGRLHERRRSLLAAQWEYERYAKEQEEGAGGGILGYLGGELEGAARFPTFGQGALVRPVLTDTEGNVLSQEFSNWYEGGGARRMRKGKPSWEDYRRINLFDGEAAPSMAALKLPPGALSKYKPSQTVQGAEIVEYDPETERLTEDEYNAEAIRKNKWSEFAGLQPSWQVANTLKSQWPEEWEEAKARYWTPERRWKSLSMNQRKALLQERYQRDPGRDWDAVASQYEPPPEWLQIFSQQPPAAPAAHVAYTMPPQPAAGLGRDPRVARSNLGAGFGGGTTPPPASPAVPPTLRTQPQAPALVTLQPTPRPSRPQLAPQLARAPQQPPQPAQAALPTVFGLVGLRAMQSLLPGPRKPAQPQPAAPKPAQIGKPTAPKPVKPPKLSGLLQPTGPL